MSYIAPNSILQLFKGINLDNRYLHTIYFANEAAQNTWFTSKVTSALTFNNLMYRRNLSNSVKIKCNAQKLLDVTYMRFKNSRVDGGTTYEKWFYCFVTGVEYINENTTEIFYEIDVMQTWFIQNGTVRPCMVIREHTNDDIIGHHLEAEPVGSDSYECDNVPYSSEDGALFNSYSLILNTSEDPDVGDIINNGLVNGTKFRVLDGSDANAVFNQITALITLINGSWSSGDKPIEVIDMFTFPTKFCSTNSQNNTHIITISHSNSLGGYTPKNNKLHTYPYSFLEGSTKNGSSATYKWEYFNSLSSIEFKCYGSPIGGGQIQCYPSSYDGITNNVDAGMVMDDFPKNPFGYDAYQAWVAAGGKVKLERAEAFTNVRGITALISSASGAISGSLTGINSIGHNALALGGTNTSIMDDISGMSRGNSTMLQSAMSYINTVVDVAEAKNKIAYAWKDAVYKPNIIVGTATPNLAIAKRHLDFHFYNAHVKVEELKKIDDFFTCFGYAINRVKTPNLTGRQYWNFVQTDKCEIAGDMPSSSKEAIGRIFDGGITFWHNGDNVGNYSQSTSGGTINNPIVT